MLWRPAALMAAILGAEALALILALAPAQPTGGRLVLFGLASLGVQWVTLGTLALLWALRGTLARRSPPALAWCGLGFLLAMTLLVALVAWELLAMPGGFGQPRWVFVSRMLALGLVVGLIGLVGFQNYWEARRLVLRTKQLELEALHARIRPHFLFNTLNTGAALVHGRPADAERVLLDLADLFRSALRGPQLIPLADELELARRYLEIEALRFGERLRIEWGVAEPLPEVAVPSLSIQPLVENAIRHGIERRTGGGRIDVSVANFPRHVEITVRNDLPEGAPATPGHSLGLASARERVDALTQGLGRVETGVEDGRFVARMRIPHAPEPADRPS